MRLNQFLGIIFIFCILNIQANSSEISKENYVSNGRLIALFSWRPTSSKFLIRIKNLTTTDTTRIGTIMPYHKGWLFYGRAETIYGENFSEVEFNNEIKQSNFQKANFASIFLGDLAWADALSCRDQSRDLEMIANIDRNLKTSEFAKILKQCNFSISKIIEKQINDAKELANGVLSGSLWEQISNAIQSIREIIPEIYEKLILPLEKLSQTAPEVANSLACGFAEKKIGHLALAAVSGGTGIPTIVARTGVEIAELLAKVSVLQKSKRAMQLLTKLSEKKLLDQETIDRVLKMENDIPDSTKSLNVKFRADDNLSKHFDRHGSEMGFKDKTEYEEAAKRFVRRKGDENTVVYPLPNGDFNKINLLTNEMVVTNKYGNIITYFKLTCQAEH